MSSNDTRGAAADVAARWTQHLPVFLARVGEDLRVGGTGDDVVGARHEIGEVRHGIDGPLDALAGAEESPGQQPRRTVDRRSVREVPLLRVASRRHGGSPPPSTRRHRSLPRAGSERSRSSRRRCPPGRHTRSSTYRWFAVGVLTTVWATTIIGTVTPLIVSRTSTPSGPPYRPYSCWMMATSVPLSTSIADGEIGRPVGVQRAEHRRHPRRSAWRRIARRRRCRRWR